MWSLSKYWTDMVPYSVLSYHIIYAINIPGALIISLTQARRFVSALHTQTKSPLQFQIHI